MTLEDIRVIEIGQALAGPFATEILANLGADVIKIENPEGGDEARRWGPPFQGDTASVFHSINGNKKSVTLDLKEKDGFDRCMELIGLADVLVHNLRPGALNRLGLGVKELTRRFPRLICAEISAYGHTGPLKDLPGYEILSQAFGGVMSMTGEPERNPVRCGPSVCDLGSGMWLAIGVLAALHERARTGKGGLVQTSLFETALAWTTISASSYLASGDEPVRAGAGHYLISPYGYFETRTGGLMLACASDNLFKKLARAIGRPELAEDDRFRDNPGRVKNRARIEGIIADILKEESQEHWFESFSDAGVPCSPVNSISEALNHEQTRALGIIRSDPENAEIASVGFPVSFNGRRPKLRHGAPALGSSNGTSWPGE